MSITSSPFAGEEMVVLTADGRIRLEARLAADRLRLAELEQQLDRTEDKDDRFAEQLRLQDRIARLRGALTRSVTVDDVAEDPDLVELGDEVELEFEDGDRSHIVLVHPVEANAEQGHVSVDAPLAQALLGCHIGADVSVDAPMGRYQVRILDRRRSH